MENSEKLKSLKDCIEKLQSLNKLNLFDFKLNEDRLTISIWSVYGVMGSFNATYLIGEFENWNSDIKLYVSYNECEERCELIIFFN